MIMEVSESEAILIETLRKDEMLRKAVFKYFEALSGIKLKEWD